MLEQSPYGTKHTGEEQEPVPSTLSAAIHSAGATRQGGIIGLPVVQVRGHFTDPFYLIEICRPIDLQKSAFKITHCRLFSDDEKKQYNWMDYDDITLPKSKSRTDKEPPEYQSFKSILELVFKDFIFDKSSITWNTVEGIAAAAGVEQAIKEQCTSEQWISFRTIFKGFQGGMPSGSGRSAIYHLLHLLQKFITKKKEHLILVENIGGGSTNSTKRSLVFYVESPAVATNTQKKRRRVQRFPNNEMLTAPVDTEATTRKSHEHNSRAQGFPNAEMYTSSVDSESTSSKSHKYDTRHKSSDSTYYSTLNDGSVQVSKSVRRDLKKEYVPDVVLLVCPWHIPPEEVEDNVLLTVSVKHGYGTFDDSVINQVLHEIFPVFMKFNVALGLIINATNATMIRLDNVNGVIQEYRTVYSFTSGAEFNVEEFSSMCVDIIHSCQQMYNDVF